MVNFQRLTLIVNYKNYYNTKSSFSVPDPIFSDPIFSEGSIINLGDSE